MLEGHYYKHSSESDISSTLIAHLQSMATYKLAFQLPQSLNEDDCITNIESVAFVGGEENDTFSLLISST